MSNRQLVKIEMTTFYQSIAQSYDDIFPYNPVQKNFVLFSAGEENRKQSVLDVGCGTGNLTLELSKEFKAIIGIDYDRDMVRMASSKIERSESNIGFQYLNMLDIERHFTPAVFDVIICFGNTLVHLTGSKEIETFLLQTRKLLRPGGKLLLQLVHYDRVLKQDIRSLPLIENKLIRFERFYGRRKDSGKLNFETTLFIKNTGRTIKNSIELYPVLKEEIELLLLNAGYTDIMYYGSFKQEPLSENSIPLIIEAK